VYKDGLLEARYLSGFFRHNWLADDWKKLNAQDGPNLWKRNKNLVRQEDIVDGNKLRGPAVLALVLGTGAIFTLSETSLDSVKDYFEFAGHVEEGKVFAEYRSISKKPNDDAQEIIQLFRSVPEETKWEAVPGTDRLRLTVSIVAVVRRNRNKFPASQSHEKQYVCGVLQKLFFIKGLALVTEALQRRFPAEEAARVVPFLDLTTLRCDLFTFSLFIRCTETDLAASALAVDSVCSSLVSLGDVQPIADAMRTALQALSDPTSQRQLAELGVTPESQLAVMDRLHAAITQASEAIAKAQESAAIAEAALAKANETSVVLSNTDAKATEALAAAQAASAALCATDTKATEALAAAQATSAVLGATDTKATEALATAQATSAGLSATESKATEALVKTSDNTAQLFWVKQKQKELEIRAIPEQEREFICGYVDRRCEEESVVFTAPRQEVLMAFGSLVSEDLNRRGLRHTIAQEKMPNGQIRNVYDRRVHLDAFAASWPKLKAMFVGNGVSSSDRLPISRKRPYEVFNWQIDLLSPEQRDHLFRDLGDDRLARATSDLEKAQVRVERRQNLFRLYSTKVKVIEELQKSSSAPVEQDFVRVFKDACEDYEARRVMKAEEIRQKQVRKTEREAKRAAKKPRV
jgi:hypothetical protein